MKNLESWWPISSQQAGVGIKSHLGEGAQLFEEGDQLPLAAALGADVGQLLEELVQQRLVVLERDKRYTKWLKSPSSNPVVVYYVYGGEKAKVWKYEVFPGSPCFPPRKVSIMM